MSHACRACGTHGSCQSLGRHRIRRSPCAPSNKSLRRAVIRTPAIGIDVGGTKTALALVDRESGLVVRVLAIATEAHEGANSLRHRLAGPWRSCAPIRRSIGHRSRSVSAQLTSVVELDVTRIANLRSRVTADLVAREVVRLSFLPFFCKSSVEALKQFPQVNATLNVDEGTVTYFEAEHLGVAVDSERGLLVPVIRVAGDLNIAGLARRIADPTRTNKLSPDELSGGTFTVTNTGSSGALFDTPIINQPQVAILGTGAVVKRPVVVKDDSGADVIAIRSMVYLALTYDHRLVDGADAARFLGAIKARLEEAAFEADVGVVTA